MGAQEVHFPALLPREPYEATGRWTEYGDNIFRLKDRKGADYLLGPTHEEMFTLLVKDLYSSYKDLPLSLYQIQTKYRDEARPRAGILRGREFVMKDSYSFDLDDDGLERSYDAHREAYIRIFDRLGLDYVIVSAMSGRDGRLGRARSSSRPPRSARTPTSRCTQLRLRRQRRGRASRPCRRPRRYDGAARRARRGHPRHPDHRDARRLVNAHVPRADRAWTAADTLKNVVVKLRTPTARREPLVIGVPGDREVDLKRLEAAVAPAEVEPLRRTRTSPSTPAWSGATSARRCSARRARGIRYLVDPRVVDGTALGHRRQRARQATSFDLVAGRDFTADGTIEAAEVRDGRPLPDVRRHRSTIARGIEIGHIFQLGRKYADALGLNVLDQNGKRSASPWAPTASASPARSPRSPSRPTTSSACAGRARSRRPTCTSSPPARTTTVFDAARDARRRAARRRGLRVLFDDRRGVSPGREVQGRRAARRADHRRRRPGPRRRRGRDARPAYGRPRGRAGRRGRRRTSRRSSARDGAGRPSRPSSSTGAAR